jgi:hypothetical protein
VRVSFGIRSLRCAKRKEVLVVETLPLFSFQRTGALFLSQTGRNPILPPTPASVNTQRRGRPKSSLPGHAPSAPKGS